MGERFDTMQELRAFCEKYAINKNFKFLTKQADKTRYTINCNNIEGCTWRLYTSILKTEGQSHFFEIQTLSSYTCVAMPDLQYKHASSSFVGSIIKVKLVNQPNYRPADIIHDIHCENGVNVGYWTAF